MKEPKPQKTITAIDPVDVGDKINQIVALMESIDASREIINDTTKYLKDKYGLNSTHVRAAATAIKNEKVEEVDEKARSIQELIDLAMG